MPWGEPPPEDAPEPVAGAGSRHHAPQPIRLSWAAPGGMVGLSVFNFLLKLPTLNAYSFWGKTEVRRRVWHAIRIDGEPLEYTGTGGELLRGFALVFLVIMLPVLLLSGAAVLAFGPAVSGAVQVAIYLAFALLYGIGVYRAQRYRLARTRWRGIRMRLTGSSWSYGLTYFGTLLLLPATLGWIAPWRTTRLQAMITRGTHFGDRPLAFTASSGPLYGRFVVLWFGCLLILMGAGAVIGAQVAEMARHNPSNLKYLTEAQQARLGAVAIATGAIAYVLYGIVSAWYRAKVINHFAAHTRLEGTRFRGSATAFGLVWLALSNAAIVLLSLGILGPVAQARSTRYLVEHLTVDGDVILGRIRQTPDDTQVRGEGLAQAFDFDAF